VFRLSGTKTPDVFDYFFLFGLKLFFGICLVFRSSDVVWCFAWPAGLDMESRQRPMHRADVPIYDALRRRESWCHSFKKEHAVWLPCQTQSMLKVQVECIINFHSTWFYMNFQPMWCLCSFAWLGCIHSNFHQWNEQWICFLPNIFKFATIWQTKRPRVIL